MKPINILLTFIVPLAVIGVVWIFRIINCRNATCDSTVNLQMSIPLICIIIGDVAVLWSQRKRIK